MEISLVIPTMKRPRNGYTYLCESLNFNKKLLDRSDVFSDRFLYFSESDSDELADIIPDLGFQHIYRPNHDALSGLDENGYEYWRQHLCLDFTYSMKAAMARSQAPYFMWLEDDTLLTSDLPSELLRFFVTHGELHIASPYHTGEYDHCAACLIFERCYLKAFVDSVEERFAEDIPLDLFCHCQDRDVVPFHKKCAYHIGRYSSRKDEPILRCEEFPTLLSRLRGLMRRSGH